MIEQIKETSRKSPLNSYRLNNLREIIKGNQPSPLSLKRPSPVNHIPEKIRLSSENESSGC